MRASGPSVVEREAPTSGLAPRPATARTGASASPSDVHPAGRTKTAPSPECEPGLAAATTRPGSHGQNFCSACPEPTRCSVTTGSRPTVTAACASTW
jgi:hypothetical protein